MKVVNIKAAKLAIVFRQGELPLIDPAKPTFMLELGTYRVECAVNAKAARKLGVHAGGAVLQGRLVDDRGTLKLLDAGFQFLDPKPAEAVGS
jgi:hypothetical protein